MLSLVMMMMMKQFSVKLKACSFQNPKVLSVTTYNLMKNTIDTLNYRYVTLHWENIMPEFMGTPTLRSAGSFRYCVEGIGHCSPRRTLTGMATYYVQLDVTYLELAFMRHVIEVRLPLLIYFQEAPEN